MELNLPMICTEPGLNSSVLLLGQHGFSCKWAEKANGMVQFGITGTIVWCDLIWV